MAIASTAAAEAAVAAAHAAAEVVWLTGLKSRNEATELEHQCERETQELAAVKIQTAFRGYLVSLFMLFSMFCILPEFHFCTNCLQSRVHSKEVIFRMCKFMII